MADDIPHQCRVNWPDEVDEEGYEGECEGILEKHNYYIYHIDSDSCCLGYMRDENGHGELREQFAVGDCLHFY